jgi:AmiR/NasT family two-component response regulator
MSHGRDPVLQSLPDRAILLVTAYSHREFKSFGPLAGVGGCVIKPVRTDTLVPVLELTLARVTELRALRDELAGLRTTLAQRRIVARAKRHLMNTLGLSEAEAHYRLRQQSMNTRRTIYDVAVAMLRQGATFTPAARQHGRPLPA